MLDRTYIPFTKEMKKDYTILVPNMLPFHFEMIIKVLENYGYNLELLKFNGAEVGESGLKYTHNDTCYPAILVIGQFIEALKSGKYDPKKVALLMFQTGGGCRASNYISLIRKALQRAGYEYVPVISFSLAGIEKHPGFTIGIKKLHRMMYAVLYGDLLMSLVNQVRPYETEKGAAKKLAEEWTDRLGRELFGRLDYKKIKKNYRAIVSDFSKIPVSKKTVVKVGIVGEIFVKYSPLANNGLEDFLISEGAEPVVPGLCDFCLFYVYNVMTDYTIYKKGFFKSFIFSKAFSFICKKRRDVSLALERGGFEGFTPFEKVVHLAEPIISSAVKMGEGWLLTAEMIELAESGAENIVCTQPFGCLPNHICGKGMMKPIKELDPNVKIVAID